MSVPDYQSIMFRFMKLAADGKEHRWSEAIEALASRFGLTDADRKEPLPGGGQAEFDSRVGWARTYLVKTGPLHSTARGRLRISQRGIEVIGSKPKELNNSFPEQFPEYLEFQNRTSATEPVFTSGGKYIDRGEQTPEEMLKASYVDLRRSLADELLERIKAYSPTLFERLVVELVVAIVWATAVQRWTLGKPSVKVVTTV